MEVHGSAQKCEMLVCAAAGDAPCLQHYHLGYMFRPFASDAHRAAIICINEYATEVRRIMHADPEEGRPARSNSIGGAQLLRTAFGLEFLALKEPVLSEQPRYAYWLTVNAPIYSYVQYVRTLYRI